jgi:hypothetical protein
VADPQTDRLLEEVKNALRDFNGRLGVIERQLDVLKADWGRTLRTWVRMERGALERDQELIRVKKNWRRRYWTLMHCTMRLTSSKPKGLRLRGRHPGRRYRGG